MAYDYPGELLRKALKLAREGRYVEAFRTALRLLSMADPSSPAWSKLYEAVLGLARMIAEAQERAMAFASLASLLASKGLVGEARRLLEEARRVASTIPYEPARRKVEEVARIIESVSAETAGASSRLLAELENLLDRVERIASISPTAAEEYISKASMLISNLEASGVDVSGYRERLRRIVERIAPRLEVEPASSLPSRVEAPSRLELVLRVANQGKVSARGVELEVRAGGAAARRSLGDIGPESSVETSVVLHIDAPGEYAVTAVTRFRDPLGEERVVEEHLGVVYAEPRRVEPLVATVGTSPGEHGELYRARVRLHQGILDALTSLSKLLGCMAARKPNECIDELEEYVERLRAALALLERVHELASRLWEASCPERVKFYTESIEVLSHNAGRLEELASRRRIAGRLGGIDAAFTRALRETASRLLELLAVEEGRKPSELVAEEDYRWHSEALAAALLAVTEDPRNAAKAHQSYVTARSMGVRTRESENVRRAVQEAIAKILDAEAEAALRCR